MVAATVVVANPVAPPSRDMQISTTQLSTSPDLLSPSDKSLLSALTPQLPLAGIGPSLAQILAALAADADRISREVASEVGPEASVSAALPEQTAYRLGLTGTSFIESPNTTPISTTSIATSVVSSDVVQVLNNLLEDGSYLGGKVVEAAFAVVDIIIRVPQSVVTAALDLLKGDIAGALDTVTSVIKAFFGPGLSVLDGIRDVFFGRLPPPTPAPTAAKSVVTQSTATAADRPATGGTARPSRDGKGGSARKPDVAPSAAGLRPTGTAPKSAAASDPATTTSAKTHSTSKPATSSTRSTAGSARDLKSGASADSSAD